jgi:outer membrane protein TolC
VRENRDLVEKEYQAGQASLVRLNEAQRDLNRAQGRLALALVGLRQALKNLDASTGRILLPFASP